MTVEGYLKKELNRKRTASEQRQIDAFEKFREELRSAGYEIRRENFSISLFERIGISYPTSQPIDD